MYVIEVKEDKFEKMAEYTEKMLKYGGKLMSSLSEIGEQYGMSFRDDEMYREPREMNERYPYGGRHINYRDDDDYDEDEMNERRYRRGGRSMNMRSRGRYGRYE